MVSSVDLLPEATLSDELVRAKEQSRQIPTVSDFLAGEHYMVVNTAKGFFTDLRKQEDLMIIDPLSGQVFRIKRTTPFEAYSVRGESR